MRLLEFKYSLRSVTIKMSSLTLLGDIIFNFLAVPSSCVVIPSRERVFQHVDANVISTDKLCIKLLTVVSKVYSLI